MGKAQTLIFEQAMLFFISVTIFVICFALFQIYQSHYTYMSLNDQVNAVRDIVSSHVLELIAFGDLNASVEFRLPKRISGEMYYISFGEGILNVTTMEAGINRTSILYGLGESAGAYEFSGKAASSDAEIIIYKRGNNIILGPRT